MGARQISVSHCNDEVSSGTAGRQHPLPQACLRPPEATRAKGSRAREDIRPYKSGKREEEASTSTEHLRSQNMGKDYFLNGCRSKMSRVRRNSSRLAPE